MKSTSYRECCAPICRVLKNSDNKLLPFPKAKKMAKRWAEALGINEQNTRDAFVCVLHFRQNDFICTKGSQKKGQQLKKTAIPSRNFLNPTIAKANLKSCYVKLSPLPIQRLKKISPPIQIKNRFLDYINNIKKGVYGKTGRSVGSKIKPKSLKLNNKTLDELVNTPDSKVTAKPTDTDTFRENHNPMCTMSKLNKPSKELKSLNGNFELKGILKNSNIKQMCTGKAIKKKVTIKTKLGQFMPKVSKKVLIRDQIKTNKEIINYEVIEQLNDCNVLILKMS